MKQPTTVVECSKSTVVEKTRTRGKKRKGRKDTSDAVDQSQKKENGSDTIADKNLNEDGDNQVNATKRRCIGRKPVTDFFIGKYYPGNIVYIKQFGLFLDIGCHSDAFCHVSRISDGFVKTIESLYKVGDQVSARVVDIDRKSKRITVSMQSETRAVDELESVNAWKVRSEKRHSKQKKADNIISSSISDESNKRIRNDKETTVSNIDTSTISNNPMKPSTPEGAKKNFDTQISTNPTRDELKRARKIARRAERRNLQNTMP